MNTTIDKTGWQTAPNTQYAENQDGAVLIDEDQGLRFVFNPVGNFIWKGLRQKRSISEITKSLAAECQVAEEQVSGSVLEFIEDLKAKQLLLSTDDIKARLHGNRHASKGRFDGLKRLISLLKWS